MDLTELLGEEIAGKVAEVAQEKGLNFLVDNKQTPAYIPKTRFDEVINQKNQLKTQLTDLTTQLTGLKKSAKGNEDLESKIADLEKNNSEWQEKYQKTLLEGEIKLKAIELKANDPSDLLRFLDREKLQIGDKGQIFGLEEQIKAVKEAKPYLFKGEEQPAGPPAAPPTSTNPAANDNRGKKSLDQEYLEAQQALKQNPSDQGMLQRLFLIKEAMRSGK
jgi:hypothetical protein